MHKRGFLSASIMSMSQEYRASCLSFFPNGVVAVFNRGVTAEERGEELPFIGLNANLDAFDGVLMADDGTSSDVLRFFALLTFDFRGVFVGALSDTTKSSLSMAAM